MIDAHRDQREQKETTAGTRVWDMERQHAINLVYMATVLLTVKMCVCVCVCVCVYICHVRGDYLGQTSVLHISGHRRIPGLYGVLFSQPVYENVHPFPATTSLSVDTNVADLTNYACRSHHHACTVA